MTLDTVLSCLPTLKRLAKAKTLRQRRKILSEAKKCLFYSICEITKNVLENNIPLSCKRKESLLPYKKHIRLLARKSGVSLKQQKKIINQRGGFLPHLLLPTVSILSQIAADRLLK